MSPQSIPLLSITGEPVFHKPVPYGETLYVELFIPVLVDDENCMWRAYYYVEHYEFEDGGNGGVVDEIVTFVSERFTNYIAPISLQRLLDKLRAYLTGLDLKSMMPVAIPEPSCRSIN